MEQDQEFTVRDRRSSSAEAEQEPIKGHGKGETAARPAPLDAGQDHDEDALPELNFSSFIISLAGTAQMSLGLMPNPETGTVVKNIPAAVQLIDLLGILQEKTKGNLSKEEDALLGQVLYNLRLHSVRVMEEEKKSGGS